MKYNNENPGRFCQEEALPSLQIRKIKINNYGGTRLNFWLRVIKAIKANINIK